MDSDFTGGSRANGGEQAVQKKESRSDKVGQTDLNAETAERLRGQENWRQERDGK